MRSPALVRALALLAIFAAGCNKKSEAAAAPDATPPPPPPSQALSVAAAADLAFAFKDVGAAFEAKTGRKVTFSFGSTGLLARQIAEGAPFDVFAAANVSFVDDVVKEGACFADSKSLYATGRIVLWTKKGNEAPKAVADLAKPAFKKVAIANPDHAPYGRAAKQAMEKAGVWSAVQPKVVFGENVQQTLQFAQSGNAEVAVVGLSLAVVSDGEYTLIDEGLHDPLKQALVVCKGAPASGGAMQPIARDFASFVGAPEGRAIMKKYGFLMPGDPAPEPRK